MNDEQLRIEVLRLTYSAPRSARLIAQHLGEDEKRVQKTLDQLLKEKKVKEAGKEDTGHMMYEVTKAEEPLPGPSTSGV